MDYLSRLAAQSQQEQRQEEGVADEAPQPGQRPNWVSLFSHSTAGCGGAAFANTTWTSCSSMRAPAAPRDFVEDFGGPGATHRQVQPTASLAPTAASPWGMAGSMHPEASQRPGEPEPLSQSHSHVAMGLLEALSADPTASAETNAQLGCKNPLLMSNTSERGGSNNNNALWQAIAKVLFQLVSEERQQQPPEVSACLMAMMAGHQESHTSGPLKHAAAAAATPEQKRLVAPSYKLNGSLRACQPPAREDDKHESPAIPPHTPSTAPSGFCLRSDDEPPAGITGSPLQQPLPPAVRLNLNCMAGGPPAPFTPPLTPLQQAQLLLSQQQQKQQQQQHSRLLLPSMKRPGLFEAREVGPRSSNSSQGGPPPFSPLAALGLSGQSIAAGITPAASLSVSPTHSAFSVTDRDAVHRHQCQQELASMRREAEGGSVGSANGLARHKAFLSGLLNADGVARSNPPSFALEQEQQLLDALTGGSPTGATHTKCLPSSLPGPPNVFFQTFEGGVPELTAAELNSLIAARGLRDTQQNLEADGQETDGVESANRSFGELRPACCYFLLGKCDFSRSCVFWHPPPEADPSLVACKYGRVCNARHGRRVPYKELAAIIHAFVRRCPQLAPGESGRLYHYLRISRAQPQQQQLQQQLTGSPGPILSPHIVNRFYGILDSVKGRDLSVVNSAWRRAFGEAFPYAMYGFEQLRAAIASIPGVRLTTKGTNVIISRRSRAPLSPPAAIPGALMAATPHALSPFAASTVQVQQDPPSPAATSPSLVLFNTAAKALATQESQQVASAPPAPQALLGREDALRI